jgi:hypothetical protein
MLPALRRGPIFGIFGKKLCQLFAAVQIPNIGSLGTAVLISPGRKDISEIKSAIHLKSY